MRYFWSWAQSQISPLGTQNSAARGSRSFTTSLKETMMCCLELVSGCFVCARSFSGPQLSLGAVRWAWMLLHGLSSVFWGAAGASGWENYKIELCSPSCLSPCMSSCGASSYKSLSYFALTFKGSVCHHLCTSLATWQAFKMSYDFNLFLACFGVFIRDVLDFH